MDKKEDNGYEALGKFVVEFSKLTYTLGLCIKKLVENDPFLIKKINDDEKIRKLAKQGYVISEKNIKELSESLRHLLTTGEICKILKSLIIAKYSHNLSFLKVIDKLFEDIDKFCSYDGYRNDFMHSGLLIDEKNLGNIMVDRKTLVKGRLETKAITLDLDELNKELGGIASNIYALSKILHFDSRIENYIIIENGKLRFLEIAKKYIRAKTKI